MADSSSSPTKKTTEVAVAVSTKEDQTEANNENETPVATSFNPSVSDELKDEDYKKIKGDAIGDTLYSERFVLTTLLKLKKFEKELSKDEDFEKELCNLWDMTIEKDVVKLLLKHKVLEIFAGIIRNTEDKRLTEILVGIIGNMCNISETRDELCINAEITAPIVDLISCTDTLTLIQLMRFFHAALVFENSGDEITWFQHFRNSENFVENFANILNNSMNQTLLINAFEALNAICAKFAVIEIQPDVKDLCFCDVFVQPKLITGVTEAFKTLLPTKRTDDHHSSNDDTSTPSQNSQKIMSLFLDIHVILSQYEKASKKCYEPIMNDLMKCVSQILSPLCQPIFLLPLTFNEQGIVENLNELFQAIGDPFDEICFAQMITIWNLIDTHRIEKENNAQKWGEQDDDEEETEEEEEEEVNSEDICMTILEFFTRTVKHANDEQLKNSLKMHTPRTILKLLSALSAGDSEEDIKDCCIKIKSTFDNLDKEEPEAAAQQNHENENNGENKHVNS